MRRLPLLALWTLGACTPVLRMPGPAVVVGAPAPDRPAPAPAPPPPKASPAPDPPRRASPRPAPTAGVALAEAATHYLSHAPRGYRTDCSGFVCAAAARAGLDLEGNTRALWELARDRGWIHHRRRPEVGDLAFFDQTYDRNRNGRLDDELTHIAVVVEVDPDGTILLAHAGTRRGRTTLRMNLERPSDHRDASGAELNSYLRSRSPRDPRRTRYLSGELWRAFATVDPGPGRSAAEDPAAGT